MNTETETNRPGSIDRKGDAGELAPVILKLKSILVPIDFSKTSQTALEYAVPLAKQFGLDLPADGRGFPDQASGREIE